MIILAMKIKTINKNKNKIKNHYKFWKFKKVQKKLIKIALTRLNQFNKLDQKVKLLMIKKKSNMIEKIK